MRRLELVAALLVFVGIALAVYLERPVPPDASLFGAEMALEPVLPALSLPGGTLELRGTVHAVDGTPAADAFLVLLRGEEDPSEAEPIYRAYTDREGRFAFAHDVLLLHSSPCLTQGGIVSFRDEVAPNEKGLLASREKALESRGSRTQRHARPRSA